MHCSQDEAVQKATKKAKRDKGVMFREKGHQEQHDFNEKVYECLEEAVEGITKQPLMESVDRSKYGWGVVAENRQTSWHLGVKMKKVGEG